MITKIRTEKEYQMVMKTIEELLKEATEKGGFHKLAKEESDLLNTLSKLAETYEDKVMEIMPIRPGNLREAVELKMVEQKLTQAKLAKALGIAAPKLSQILSGKREPDVAFLKAIHDKLKIDAEFILSHA
ncbi:helix-turn-helix domain-containing protein [uncultured Imperialibacter sp.]|tara:strand:+ start:11284 stop:11673 length:390 start_codon:yes stop_codon:yes gene_type:complete